MAAGWNLNPTRELRVRRARFRGDALVSGDNIVNHLGAADRVGNEGAPIEKIGKRATHLDFTLRVVFGS
jgi:hypothetical protein